MTCVHAILSTVRGEGEGECGGQMLRAWLVKLRSLQLYGLLAWLGLAWLTLIGGGKDGDGSSWGSLVALWMSPFGVDRL